MDSDGNIPDQLFWGQSTDGTAHSFLQMNIEPGTVGRAYEGPSMISLTMEGANEPIIETDAEASILVRGSGKSSMPGTLTIMVNCTEFLEKIGNALLKSANLARCSEGKLKISLVATAT